MLILLKFLEFRQMRRYFGIRKPFAVATVISHAQRNEMITDNTANIEFIVEMLQVLIVKKFVFRVSHGISSLKSLTPVQWVGRHVTLRLR